MALIQWLQANLLPALRCKVDGLVISFSPALRFLVNYLRHLTIYYGRHSPLWISPTSTLHARADSRVLAKRENTLAMWTQTGMAITVAKYQKRMQHSATRRNEQSDSGRVVVFEIHTATKADSIKCLALYDMNKLLCMEKFAWNICKIPVCGMTASFALQKMLYVAIHCTAPSFFNDSEKRKWKNDELPGKPDKRSKTWEIVHFDCERTWRRKMWIYNASSEQES